MILKDHACFRFPRYDDKGFRHDSADLAAAGQYAFEEALLAVVRWLVPQNTSP